jgi:hypothetical protein
MIAWTLTTSFLSAPRRTIIKAIEAKRPTREELEQKFGTNFGLDGKPFLVAGQFTK